jgi:cellulose synthase/poly-beta-1,6-N-acetylglucosamine synthase-like glycosyltransferase
VSADGSVDDVTAAQWTVEQSTGEFVALVASGYIVNADAIGRLLRRLRSEPRMEAAILVEPVNDLGDLGAQPHSDCRLLIQKKSRYLATSSGRWPLTVPAVAKTLEAGAPIAIIAPRRSEMD